MKLYKVKVLVLGFALFLGFLGRQVLAETNVTDAAELFEVYKDKVYQVRTINRTTDAKSTIGSSFQITADGLMVTNFHVVSDYVHDHETNRLEYINSNGDKGELEVIAVDVINDLALVKHTSQYSAHFNLSNSLPTQGDAIYSLGNPHDVGLTVVPGVYNGYIENSYYERLHFTGSLNGGVSGGPVINDEGKVIGVNVASSGNQLSYLVPLDKVKSLLAREEQASVISLEKSIQLQLDDHQKRIMDDLMVAKWPRVSMGDATVYGELQPYILCWDSSEEAKKEKLYQFNKTSCSNSDYIYLSKNLESGEYQFFYYWLESEHLNSLQFSSLYKNKLPLFSINTLTTKEDSTNFECKNSFVKLADADESLVVKTVFCARAYKNYPKLYDVLFLAQAIPRDNKALVVHFTLAGVGKESSIKFTEKFVRGIIWQ